MVSRLRADSEDLISENKSLKIENEEFKPLFDDQEPKLGDKDVKSDEDLNKIKEELKLLKNLRSKYTIQYYGEYHKKETNDFFIIMEYAENGSLENFVRKSPYLNLDSSIRMVREIVTLYWMAPELLVKDNNNFNPFQSDIYSLGMVIYELLVRLEPFDDYDYSEERLIEEIVENNA
ncbi:11083_t:CDS:2, partial [Paraglomus occultum]